MHASILYIYWKTCRWADKVSYVAFRNYWWHSYSALFACYCFKTLAVKSIKITPTNYSVWSYFLHFPSSVHYPTYSNILIAILLLTTRHPWPFTSFPITWQPHPMDRVCHLTLLILVVWNLLNPGFYSVSISTFTWKRQCLHYLTNHKYRKSSGRL